MLDLSRTLYTRHGAWWVRFHGKSGKETMKKADLKRGYKIHPSHPVKEQVGEFCRRCGLSGKQRTEHCALIAIDIRVRLTPRKGVRKK